MFSTCRKSDQNYWVDKIKKTSSTTKTFRFSQEKPRIKSREFLNLPIEKKIEALQAVNKASHFTALDFSGLSLDGVKPDERRKMFNAIDYNQIRRLNLSNTQYFYGLKEQPGARKEGYFYCVQFWESTMREFYSNIRVEELIVTEFDNYIFCSSIKSLITDHGRIGFIMKVSDERVLPPSLRSLIIKNPASMGSATIDDFIEGMAKQKQRGWLPSLTHLDLTIPAISKEQYIALLKAIPDSLLTLRIKISGKINVNFTREPSGPEPMFLSFMEGEGNMFPLSDIPLDIYSEILPPQLRSFITDDPASNEILDAVKHIRTISTALTTLPKSATDAIASYARENPLKFWKEKPDLELKREAKQSSDMNDLEDDDCYTAPLCSIL